MKQKYLLIFLLTMATGVFAETPASSQRTGLIFDLSGLLSGIAASTDGYQSGAGMKFYPTENLALRGLTNFYYASNQETDTSQSSFGLGLGAEYHFVKATVSPYAGGYLGFSTSSSTAGGTTTPGPGAFYLGFMGGGEILLQPNISLFCEYNALMVFGETFTFRLGQDGAIGKNALLGVIFYF